MSQHPIGRRQILRSALFVSTAAAVPLSSLALSGNAAAANVRSVDAVRPYGRGAYTDGKTGTTQTWYVNQVGTLYWQDTPFVPIGGMWCSKYLIYYNAATPTTNEANWAYDTAILDRMAAGGVRDVYLNAVVNGTTRPAAVWQRVVDAFEDRGFSYGLQFNGRSATAPAMPAYIVRANEAGGTLRVENISADGYVSISVPTSLVVGLQSARGGLFLVVETATGEAVQTGQATAGPIVSGRFTLTAAVSVPSDAPHTVYFIPFVTFMGTSLTNIWDAADATVSGLRSLLSQIRFGPGLRLFVDPVLNESGIVNWYESLLIASPVWRGQFTQWLTSRYSSLSAVADAWRITPAPPSYEAAARLVPLQTGPKGSSWAGRLYLMDPDTGTAYRADARAGRLWDDVLEFRDDSFRAFNDRVADAVSEYADVPVVYKNVGVLKRYNVYRDTGGGTDGLGGEIYGAEPDVLRRRFSDNYAATQACAKTTWCIVTETQQDENVTRKADSGVVGWPDKATMFAHFDTLLDAGAKGIYDFLFHTPSDPKLMNYYSYTAKPEQFGWLLEYRTALLADRLPQVAGATSKIARYYVYPAGQMWWFKPTQRTAVLPGDDYDGAGSMRAADGTWALPSFDWDVDTRTLVFNLQDDPATTVWGGPVRAVPDLTQSGRNLVYLGLRRNLGALPGLDAYFTGEFVTLDSGDTVQVLRPTSRCEILQATPDGKVWALRDRKLTIVSNAHWIDSTYGGDRDTIRFLADLGL